MSIIASLDPASAEAEKKRRAEALAESLARVAASTGLTPEELTDALREAINKKRLARTDKEVAGMAATGVRR